MCIAPQNWNIIIEDELKILLESYTLHAEKLFKKDTVYIQLYLIE